MGVLQMLKTNLFLPQPHWWPGITVLTTKLYLKTSLVRHYISCCVRQGFSAWSLPSRVGQWVPGTSFAHFLRAWMQMHGPLLPFSVLILCVWVFGCCIHTQTCTHTCAHTCVLDALEVRVTDGCELPRECREPSSHCLVICPACTPRYFTWKLRSSDSHGKHDTLS